MVGPEAAARVAVEVLVKEHEVTPVGVAGEPLDVPVDGTAARPVTQEDAGEPLRQLAGHLAERREPSRAARAFDFEPVPVEVIEFLERLHEQVVDGKPHGAAPVRIAAEEP